jgi:hypothetical protein
LKFFLKSDIIFISLNRSVAQVGEHVPWEHGVAGSSPATPTIKKSEYGKCARSSAG